MSDIRVRSLLSEMERFASYPIPSGVMSIPVKDVAERLRRAVDAPDTPTIIRTVEELEALDPETPIWSRNAGYLDVAEFLNAIEYDIDYADDLPAVVVATAEQVRAARKALEEA